MLLNASGCLDALTAPETARSLDAFVTKTVTPLPRGGNAPVRIAETDVGMLNSIGLANPGRERFLAETLPAAPGARRAALGLRRRLRAQEYAETCARLEDVTIELNLSCPNVDEAPESAAEIVAACRAATSLPLYAKLSPANWDIARARPRGRGRRAPTGSRVVNTIRGMKLDASLRPVLGDRDRRPLRAGAEADRARGGPCLLPSDTAADRRDGRCCQRTRRARALRGRGERRRARHRALLGPVRAGPDPGGVVGRTGNTRARVGRAGARDFARRGVAKKKTPRSRVESLLEIPANRGNRPQLTASSKLLDSLTYADEDPGYGASSLSRSAHGGPCEGERHPRPPGAAEEGPEAGKGPDRRDPRRPAGVRLARRRCSTC